MSDDSEDKRREQLRQQLRGMWGMAGDHTLWLQTLPLRLMVPVTVAEYARAITATLGQDDELVVEMRRMASEGTRLFEQRFDFERRARESVLTKPAGSIQVVEKLGGKDPGWGGVIAVTIGALSCIFGLSVVIFVIVLKLAGAHLEIVRPAPAQPAATQSSVSAENLRIAPAPVPPPAPPRPVQHDRHTWRLH